MRDTRNPWALRRTLDAEEFQELGSSVAKIRRSSSKKVMLRRFKAEFGAPPEAVVDAWDLLMESAFLRDQLADTSRPPNPDHFLWALMLLKKYSVTTTLANSVGVDEKTFRKWSWIYLEATAELDKKVVRPI